MLVVWSSVLARLPWSPLWGFLLGKAAAPWHEGSNSPGREIHVQGNHAHSCYLCFKNKDLKSKWAMALAPDLSSGLNSSHSNQTPPTCQEKKIRLINWNMEWLFSLQEDFSFSRRALASRFLQITNSPGMFKRRYEWQWHDACGAFGLHIPYMSSWWPCQTRAMETQATQGCIKIAFLEPQWRERIFEYTLSDSNVMKPGFVLVLAPSANPSLIQFRLQLQSTVGVKSISLEGWLPGFESQLCPLLFLWPWESYLASVFSSEKWFTWGLSVTVY